MTDKKIKPTNPDTEKTTEADGKQAAERKTAAGRYRGRTSGRKTMGIRPKF